MIEEDAKGEKKGPGYFFIEMAATFGLGSTLRPRGRPRIERRKVVCPLLYAF
jgi:hypothetical protein